MTVAGTDDQSARTGRLSNLAVRAISLVSALLMLSACGGAERTEAHYEVESAKPCILQGGQGDVAPQPLGERPGSFELIFGESLTGYVGFLVVVGYGPDQATAIDRENHARDALPKKMLGDRMWSRRDGNVVYEAFGPVASEGLEEHLPHRLTLEDVHCEIERISTEMRGEFADCLMRARVS
jgi:hypothetical protein